jgi:hypothetical protein
MYGSAGAFPDRGDTILIQTRYADGTRLYLTALRPDGSTDAAFGDDGRAQIATPWQGSSEAAETIVWFEQAGPSAVVVIATSPSNNGLQLVRVRG